MTHVRRAIVAAVVVFASAAVAFADPITIIRDGRHASVGPVFFGTSATPISRADADDVLVAAVAAPPGSNTFAGTATLTSSVADPLHWSATGMASVSWATPADIQAGTDFFTEFLVTSPVQYSFNGSMAASASSEFGGSDASTLALFSVATGIFDRDNEELFRSLFSFDTDVAGTNSENASRSFSGVLEPGKYQMLVDARARGIGQPPTRAVFGSANANFTFALDFTPAEAAATPEPASLMLLATGVAGVFGFRRRATTPRR